MTELSAKAQNRINKLRAHALETYPDGVAAGTTANTYRVLPGTQLSVTATPEETHYFQNWNSETALNSNTAVDTTFEMPTDDMALTANFHAKPTLTLAQNESEWGSVSVQGNQSLLSGALVNGATIEVVCQSSNGIQMGGNFTYNDGVFTRNNFVGNALYINQMKATATVSGTTITIATGIGDYSDFDHNVMLNTSDDTYTLTGGSSIGSVISVKVNGVEILDKLTEEK